MLAFVTRVLDISLKDHSDGLPFEQGNAKAMRALAMALTDVELICVCGYLKKEKEKLTLYFCS